MASLKRKQRQSTVKKVSSTSWAQRLVRRFKFPLCYCQIKRGNNLNEFRLMQWKGNIRITDIFVNFSPVLDIIH